MWESYSHTRRELRSVKNARGGHVQCFKMGGCFCRAGQDFLTFQRDARNVEFCATYLICQCQQLIYQKSNVKQNPLAVVSL